MDQDGSKMEQDARNMEGAGDNMPPQPQPRHALSAQGQEIERLWNELRKASSTNTYLLAMLAEKEEIIGSLLAQISQQTPAPESTEG